METFFFIINVLLYNLNRDKIEVAYKIQNNIAANYVVIVRNILLLLYVVMLRFFNLSSVCTCDLLIALQWD
jgi:hypothetical protein